MFETVERLFFNGIPSSGEIFDRIISDSTNNLNEATRESLFKLLNLTIEDTNLCLLFSKQKPLCQFASLVFLRTSRKKLFYKFLIKHGVLPAQKRKNSNVRKLVFILDVSTPYSLLHQKLFRNSKVITHSTALSSLLIFQSTERAAV
jgi:hypothetical protein